jgi:FtsZ-binding cell division protein ZapB
MPMKEALKSDQNALLNEVKKLQKLIDTLLQENNFLNQNAL